MSPDERERFAALVDELDERVSQRPDILASPMGFVLSALIGAGRSDPADAWRQIAGLADVLAYVVLYVQGSDGATVDAIVAAFLPPAVLAG